MCENFALGIGIIRLSSFMYMRVILLFYTCIVNIFVKSCISRLVYPGQDTNVAREFHFTAMWCCIEVRNSVYAHVAGEK
jgi:hypothetical protein